MPRFAAEVDIRVRQLRIFLAEVVSVVEARGFAAQLPHGRCEKVRFLAAPTPSEKDGEEATAEAEQLPRQLLESGCEEMSTLRFLELRSGATAGLVAKQEGVQYEIRNLTEADYGVWRESFCWFQQQQFDLLGMPCPKLTDEDLRLMFGEILADGPAICAVDGEEPLGFAMVSIRRGYPPQADGEQRVAFLSEFWVMPRAHRQGVGKALVHATNEAVREYNCSRTVFFCIARNSNALSFYTAVGATILPHVCFQLSGDALRAWGAGEQLEAVFDDRPGTSE